jgi:hypothetical protein
MDVDGDDEEDSLDSSDDDNSLPKFNKLLDLLSPRLQSKERYATISSGEPIQCCTV